jgi:hypothetical protein
LLRESVYEQVFNNFSFCSYCCKRRFCAARIYDQGKNQQQQTQAAILVEEEEEEEHPEVPAAPPVVAQPIVQGQNARIVEEDQPILQREGWVNWLFGHCSLL